MPEVAHALLGEEAEPDRGEPTSSACSPTSCSRRRRSRCAAARARCCAASSPGGSVFDERDARRCSATPSAGSSPTSSPRSSWSRPSAGPGRPDLWRDLEENGLTLPLVPEATGGAGLGWQDAHVILERPAVTPCPRRWPRRSSRRWLLAGAGTRRARWASDRSRPSQAERTAASRARRRRLASQRDGGAGAVGRVGQPRGRRQPSVDGQATVALVAGGRARVTPDRNLALEPRDTLDLRERAGGGGGSRRRPVCPRTPSGSTARSRAPAQMAGALRVDSRPVRPLRHRAQAVRPAHRRLPGHPASARPARRPHRGRRAWPPPTRAGRPSAAIRHVEVAAAKVRVGEAAGCRRPASRTRRTGPSASPTSTACTSPRDVCGRGARSSGRRATGLLHWADAWRRAAPISSGLISPRPERPRRRQT